MVSMITLFVVFLLAGFSPGAIQRFERAKIGDEITISAPVGDGCNSCTVTYIKVSEKEVKGVGWGFCTLLNCTVNQPMIKFK